MITNIETILHEITEKMMSEGCEFNAKLGDFRINSQNEIENYPLILFNVRRIENNRELQNKRINLSVTFAFFNELNSDDTFDYVLKWSELRKLQQVLIRNLELYENSEGQQIIVVISDSEVPFYDSRLLNRSATGTTLDITLTLESTNQC
jgi:hypothetical protein